MKDYRTREHLANRSIDRAQELACMVRDEGREAIGDYLDGLDRQNLYGLTVALAAMVPIDQTADELLAWVNWEPQVGRPRSLPDIPDPARAAHATFRRLKKAGMEIPPSVREGERAYQRIAYHRKQARKGDAAA